MLLARILGEYARLPLRGECRFRAPMIKPHHRFPSIKPCETWLTSLKFLVNQLCLNYYGASISDTMFQIVMAPITIPTPPIPIANSRKFFLSAML
jgi:hypothetical protein